jgi:DHA3 family tetracycline resistance protein-like MFS transporter
MSAGPPAAEHASLKPEALYFLLAGAYSFFFTLAITVNLVFQTLEAGLNPFQLVLIGSVLEATRFFSEVPTGVVADSVSRRLSILIGLCFVGAGLVVGGAFTHFETILAAQVVMGIGLSFLSGAREAWIADEIGPDRAAPIYLRATQVELIGRLLAIPISTALATLDLSLPIILGGALLFPVAVLTALTMPERGFQHPPRDSRAWQNLSSTLASGTALVRQSPLLITVFVITACYGLASEGFERLWVAHFDTNLGFPSVGSLEPVVWLGAVRMGSALVGLGAVEMVRRYFKPTRHGAVSRTLFLIYCVQLASFLAFTLTDYFVIGMLMFWSVVGMARAFHPLQVTWINQNVDPSVRATMLSINSQSDAAGQILGGPPLGAIGSLAGLRAALLSAAAVMAFSLPLFLRAFRQGRGSVPDSGTQPEKGASRASS